MNNTRYWLRGLLAIAAAVGIAASLAGASENGRVHDDDRERAAALLDTGDIRPLNEILERVQALRPGRILEVELESEDEGHYYEVEMLDPEGRVWELKFDAASGELIEEELER